jgi:hypothetical protein
MAKDHGASVKDDEQYEALRRGGESKEKAARWPTTTGDRASTSLGLLVPDLHRRNGDHLAARPVRRPLDLYLFALAVRLSPEETRRYIGDLTEEDREEAEELHETAPAR